MNYNNGTVIFVDDDELLRQANSQSLSLAGFTVRTYAEAASALAEIKPEFDGAVISDIRMPGMDGIQFFHAIHDIDPQIPVVLITGHGDIPMAVSALKSGAHDFLSKPFAAEHLIATVRSACNLRSLQLENRRLRQAAELAASKSPLIGESPAIARLRSLISQVAGANVDAVIEGETGTGKELVARMVHRASSRRGRAFVSVACGAVAPDLFENGLFGDAAPGQSRGHMCQVESAHNGTLFLDDIDQMPLSAQSRLMQLLENGVLVTRQGSIGRPVDIRIIATCKKPLLEAVREQRFREDLFYRLSTSRLIIPPLRDRKADIPLLFAHFVNEVVPKGSHGFPDMPEVVRRHLQDHQWPGNARELCTFATRFALNLLEPEELGSPRLSMGSLAERTRSYESSLIEDTLRRHEGNVSATLAELQLPRKTFYDKLNRYGIDIGRFRMK